MEVAKATQAMVLEGTILLVETLERTSWLEGVPSRMAHTTKRDVLMSFWQDVQEGYREAMRIGLDRQENWVPLYIYLHVTRLIVGFILGTVFGLGISSGVAILLRR